MLIQENLNNGFIKTFSDSNKYIIQNETGIKYYYAIDIPGKYTYTESVEELSDYSFPKEGSLRLGS